MASKRPTQRTTRMLTHFVAASTLFVVAACGDESSNPSSREAIVTNDSATLSSRIKVVARKVTVDPPKSAQGRLAFNLAASSLPVIGLIAEVAAPTISGHSVQATAVARTPNGVIIGYNTAGEPYRGALDVIINIPSTAEEAKTKFPKIVSQLAFSDSEVNSIVVDGDTVYFTGASSRDASSPAFLGKSTLSSGAFAVEGTRIGLPSYAGVALALIDDAILTGSGDRGGVSAFNRKTLERITASTFSDVRSLAAAKGQYAVLSGQPGILRYFTSGGTLLRTVNVGGLAVAEARARVIVGKEISVVSLGTSGVKIICNDDGSELGSALPLTKSGLSAALTPVNSVSAYGKLIFTANGEAGVGLYAIEKGEKLGSGSKCKARTLTALGSLNFGAALSANEIAVKGNTLYVADGLGGLKILTLTDIASGIEDGEELGE